MRKRLLLPLLALAALASFALSSSATAKTEGGSAGTAIIVHDQEPGILNPFLSEGNGYTNSLAMNPVLASGSIYDSKAALKPYLLVANPKLLAEEPLRATATY